MKKEQMKKIILLISIVLFVAMVFIFSSFGQEKTLIFGYHGKPITFDIANHRSRHVTAVGIQWTDALTISLPDSRQLPNVAESFNQLDPLTYEIKIRRGITFHNGDPLTADDVIFSYKRFFGEGGMEGVTSPRRSLFGQLEYVEKIDDYTVRAHLNAADPSADTRWIFLEIMPKRYFEEVGVDEFLKKPIGCGPFKFVEGDLDTQVVFERYEDYWGGNPEYPGEVDRVPALDRVIIKFIEEPTTRIAALMSGDIDIMTRVDLDIIPSLEKNPDIKIVSGPGTTTNQLAFNTRRPPFDDVRLRQAVAHAIDYKQIVDLLYLGYSELLGGIPNLRPLTPSTTFYEYYDNLQPLEYNPEKARALLMEAGVKDLKIVLDTSPIYSEQAQVIAQMLTDIGIETSVRIWEEATLFELWKKEDCDRQMLLLTVGNSIRGMAGPINDQITGHPLNYSGYSDLDFDELFNKASYAPLGINEWDELWIKVYEKMMEDLPYINLHIPMLVEAARSNVVNYQPHYQDRIYLHHVDLK